MEVFHVILCMCTHYRSSNMASVHVLASGIGTGNVVSVGI